MTDDGGMTINQLGTSQGSPPSAPPHGDDGGMTIEQLGGSSQVKSPSMVAAPPPGGDEGMSIDQLNTQDPHAIMKSTLTAGKDPSDDSYTNYAPEGWMPSGLGAPGAAEKLGSLIQQGGKQGLYKAAKEWGIPAALDAFSYVLPEGFVRDTVHEIAKDWLMGKVFKGSMGHGAAEGAAGAAESKFQMPSLQREMMPEDVNRLAGRHIQSLEPRPPPAPPSPAPPAPSQPPSVWAPGTDTLQNRGGVIYPRGAKVDQPTGSRVGAAGVAAAAMKRTLRRARSAQERPKAH